jgi:hypothetical protein
MSDTSKEFRVLAIDPTTRGFAFAVMEGPRRLVDWGVKSVRPARQDRCLARVAAQIKFFAPTILVIENATGRGSRRCGRVRQLIQDIRALAAKMRVRTRLVSRRQVKTAFAPSGALTKHQIALAIAQQLPELTGRVPPCRKPWMSEDERMNLFDAVAFALTFYRLREKRRLARSPHPS